MMRFRAPAALLSIAAVTTSMMMIPPASATDTDGAKLFKTRCGACHWDPHAAGEKPRLGPSLSGLSGRTAGTTDFKRYSKAMKASGIVWEPESLNAYLENPRKTVPGTTMAFPGLKKPNRRAAVVSYVLDAGK